MNHTGRLTVDKITYALELRLLPSVQVHARTTSQPLHLPGMSCAVHAGGTWTRLGPDLWVPQQTWFNGLRGQRRLTRAKMIAAPMFAHVVSVWLSQILEGETRLHVIARDSLDQQKRVVRGRRSQLGLDLLETPGLTGMLVRRRGRRIHDRLRVQHAQVYRARTSQLAAARQAVELLTAVIGESVPVVPFPLGPVDANAALCDLPGLGVAPLPA